MIQAKKSVLICICFLIYSFHSIAQNKTYPVVMVSFDGFRFDYAEKFNAPNFIKLKKRGASAHSLIPSYPSKTFPNHYTLVTGLYPDHHGLIDNRFQDRKRNEIYQIRNREMVEDPYYYGGYPIWQWIQKQGGKAASFFWVGSEAPIKGSFPDRHKIYDSSVNNEHRIDTVLSWLRLPDSEKPDFISLYFSLVDSQGHDTGPNHAKTGSSVLEADRLTGILMNKLNALEEPVNLIITSDHGMIELNRTDSLYIPLGKIKENYKNTDWVNNQTHCHIYVDRQSQLTDIYKELYDARNHYRVFIKENIPAYLHYGSNERVGDILVIADPGFLLSNKKNEVKSNRNTKPFGTHGYDGYLNKDMHGIFYAMGPNIKEGTELPSFENIHVFPFIVETLLGLPLPEIDGNSTILKHIYTEQKK